MRILVTGAAGFIGNRLVHKLQAEEHEVFALVRDLPVHTPSWPVHWVQQDLSQPLDYSRLPGRVDAVIHLAQSRFYRQFPERAEDIFRVNIQGTFQLLEYARNTGAKRFIFTSTGGVYGYSYEKFVETDPVSPLDFYLSSKYATELLIGNYQKFFQTIVFRLFFVYGAGQRPTMLMPRLVRSVLSGEPITLQGEEGIKINPVYVDDVTDSLRLALTLEGSHLINVGGPQVLSLREIGHIIGGHLNREPQFTVIKQEPGHMVGDVNRMERLLKRSRVSFSEGIMEVCREMNETERRVED